MSFALLHQLKTVMVKELASLKLENWNGEMVAPGVHISALPPKRKDRKPIKDEDKRHPEGEHFPFVVIRFDDGEDTEAEGAEGSVRFVCGAYAKEFEDGEAAVWRLVDRVRHILLTARTCGAFRLEFPLGYQVGNDEERSQPHPFHLGAVKTKWRGPHTEYLLTQEDS